MIKANFNPRTHEGCDAYPICQWYCSITFQSTHPWRVRPVKSSSILFSSLFQSTHPWRVRLIHLKRTYVRMIFQSTHPWRVRRDGKEHSQFIPLFQSTHPWRVRRGKEVEVIASNLISIHTPMKGATLLTNTIKTSTLFQSTHPWRVRRCCPFYYWWRIRISIHTPMKGATAFFSPFVRLIYTANHFFKSFVSFFLIFCELGLCFLCSDKNLM